jgi:hypothetical protein
MAESDRSEKGSAASQRRLSSPIRGNDHRLADLRLHQHVARGERLTLGVEHDQEADRAGIEAQLRQARCLFGVARGARLQRRLGAKRKGPRVEGLSCSVVARAGFEPATFGL